MPKCLWPLLVRHVLQSGSRYAELTIQRLVIEPSVNLSVIEVFMAQQLLERVDGHALIEQPRGECVAELVRRYINPGLFPVLS